MTTEPWSTSKTLQVASGIAARFERRGEQISAAEAIERAAAGEQQLTQLAALREQYPGEWDDTVIAPPLPVGMSLAA